MKFNCDKARLLAAVTTLSRFTDKDDDRPGLDRLLFRAADGLTELHATIDDDGEAAIPAELLQRALEGVERARVDVRAKARGRGANKEWIVNVAGGGTALEFQFHDVPPQPVLFPPEQLSAPEVDVTALRPIDSGFKSVLAATIYCTSGDVERIHLMGVHLEVGQRTIRAVSTDGHRLAVAEVPASATKIKGGTFEVTMPARAVSLVLGAKGEVTHIRLVRADRLAMRVGHLLVVTKPIDAKFAEWRPLMPTGEGNRLMVSRLELLAACKAAMKLGSVAVVDLEKEAPGRERA